ncbi:fibronectin type III domain-containing protein [Saccharothrix sp. BKS2]|uniref:fibronectin type III domain-containing protein n=1 Tax=Saccharothrix sp. BKS2 TaxID=3064400 RepID=UPI0039EA7608
MVFLPANQHRDPAGEWSVTITAAPGGRTAVVKDRDRASARVTGLTNRTAYTFTAVETVGGATSPRSAASEPVVPRVARRPPAPTIDSVLGRDKSLVVHWNPGADRGAPITGYTVTAAPSGKKVTVAGDVRTATPTGLTNGRAQTVSVAATNKIGTGKAATEGDAVPEPPYAPGKPRAVSAVPSRDGAQGSLDVTWQPPLDDGGAAITSYTVTTSPGGRSVAVPGSAGTATVTGLDPKVVHVVGVTAANGAGGRLSTAGTARAEPGYKIGEKTVKLTVNSMDAISEIAHDRVVFDQATPQVKKLVKGQVIVAEARQPRPRKDLLRKITDDSKLQAEAELGFEAALTGEVTVTPDWSVNVDMSWFHLDSASVSASATVRASLDGRFAAMFSGSAEPEKPLAEYDFQCCTVWIGWFPLALCPKFTFSGKLSAEGSLEFTFDADSTRTPRGRIALGVDVGLTFRVPLLELDESVSVHQGEWPVRESGDKITTLKVEPTTRKVRPGESVQFTATAIGCDNTQPITWSLGENALGTIGASGLCTAPPTGSAQDKVIAGKAATGTCSAAGGHAYVQSGVVAPSAPRDLSSRREGANVVLSWTPPADNGQEAVTYGVVVCKSADSDDSCTLQEPTSATTFTVVTNPGTTDMPVRATVPAHNSAGNGPPARYLPLV